MSDATARSSFLTAEWRKLIMANYEVDPSILKPYLPAGTELDQWQDRTYCSLVGFNFHDVRVRGLRIPFHTTFPEVNLRFYVRHKDQRGQWKRGVVFISEIVPRPAITWVANTLFREHYMTLPMRHVLQQTGDQLDLAYRWKYRGNWNEIAVTASSIPEPLQTGSKAEFITEHYWGYAAIDQNRSSEYQVEHPSWNIHQVLHHDIDCDFAGIYGAEFASLKERQPESIFLAEGSAIKVYPKNIIQRSS